MLGAMWASVTLGFLLQGTPASLPQGHSHNDYLRDRPLFEALDAGFGSVEADVFLVDGDLRVAHTRAEIRPERTLRDLYLEPLARRVRERGGWVHQPGVPFQLLVDVKADGTAVLEELDRQLAPYAFMLATSQPGAVRIVISGDRDRESIFAHPRQWYGYDGRYADLPDRQTSPTLMPLISESWMSHFTWMGTGAMPEPQRMRLHSMVRQAHRAGRKIRFWAHPQTPDAYRELRAAGADWFNSDRPAQVLEWQRLP